MGQKDIPLPKPTLEADPDHEIVKKLIARNGDAIADDAGRLLCDQALLLEGVPLENPAAFVQRLNRILALSAVKALWELLARCIVTQANETLDSVQNDTNLVTINQATKQSFGQADRCFALSADGIISMARS